MGSQRLTNTLNINQGGTGVSSIGLNTLLTADGTSLNPLSPLVSGQVVSILGGSPTPSPGDKIVQAVMGTYGTTTVISDKVNPVPTGLVCTITPLYIDSKILVMLSQTGVGKYNLTNSWMGLSLWRNAINLGEFAYPLGYTGESNYFSNGTASHTAIDNPNTLSAVTYSTKGLLYQGGAATPVGQVACQWLGSVAVSTMVLMEILNN